jgi:transcriptional regulator with XRE-family HTH domain
MAIGKSIRLLREALDIQQNDFAEKCDVEVGTLSALENRDSSRTKYARQIANKGFGISTDLLETISDMAAADSIARAIKAGTINVSTDGFSIASVAAQEQQRPTYQPETASLVERIEKLDKKSKALVYALVDTIEAFQDGAKKKLPGKQTKLVLKQGENHGSEQRKSHQG